MGDKKAHDQKSIRGINEAQGDKLTNNFSHSAQPIQSW